MDLTVREAATLLGVPTRTLRGQLARGDMPGKRRGGRWVLCAQDLPLNEAQRRQLAARADAVRATVEEALPSRLAPTRGSAGRSVLDCAVYRTLRGVIDGIRAAPDQAGLQPALDALRASVLDLSDAIAHFDADIKRELLLRARSGIGRAVGLLLLAADNPPPEPFAGWILGLEQGALPALSGLLRWVERLPGPRR